MHIFWHTSREMQIKGIGDSLTYPQTQLKLAPNVQRDVEGESLFMGM